MFPAMRAQVVKSAAMMRLRATISLGHDLVDPWVARKLRGHSEIEGAAQGGDALTIPRRCVVTGCGEISVPGTSRCPEHPYKSGWAQRPSSTPASAYRTGSRKIRARKLERDLLCEIRLPR